MGNVKVINRSVLEDYAAVMRVGTFMAGLENEALHDTNGNQIIKIKKMKGICYLVTDAE